MGEIYKVTNILNDFVYIGKTTQTLNIRKKDHLSKARRHVNNLRFHNAIRFYDSSNFIWKTLEKCDDSMLDEKEIYYIQLFDSSNKDKGYNMTLGGDNDPKCNLGRKYPESKCKKLYKEVFQYDLNGTFINKFVSIKHAGEATAVNLCNISKVCNRHTMTSGGFFWRFAGDSVTKDDIFRLHKSNRFQTNVNWVTKRPIIQYNKTGILIKEWVSIQEASDSIGINSSGICRACSSPTTHLRIAAGFIWRYKEHALLNEDILNIKTALKRKEISKESRKIASKALEKVVYQYTKEGIFIKRWESVRKASTFLNIDNGGISRACRGIQKMAGEFIWKYEGEIK